MAVPLALLLGGGGTAALAGLSQLTQRGRDAAGTVGAWGWNLQPGTPNVRYQPGDTGGTTPRYVWHHPWQAPQQPAPAPQPAPQPAPAPFTPTVGGTQAGWTDRDTANLYTDQITGLERLLGTVGAQRQAGLDRIQHQRNLLADERARTMGLYDEQVGENERMREQGIANVDNFAERSLTGLMSLLRGAGAGVSSAADILAPHLVSRAAGTRRQGVINTAGQNERDIAIARQDAEDQYLWAGEDIGAQEQAFREGLLTRENEISNQILDLINQRAAARGDGFEAARAQGEAIRAGIDARTQQLESLFGQFNPRHRTVEAVRPGLSQFIVDPAEIRADQTEPMETRLYLPQVRRRRREEI